MVLDITIGFHLLSGPSELGKKSVQLHFISTNAFFYCAASYLGQHYFEVNRFQRSTRRTPVLMNVAQQLMCVYPAELNLENRLYTLYSLHPVYEMHAIIIDEAIMARRHLLFVLLQQSKLR